MFKRIFAVAVIGAALAACGGAQAGTPTSVVNATGTATYPTESALGVEKDTSTGNRVKVRYSSGFQYVADDASWSRYALLAGGLTKPVAVPTSTTGLVIDIAKAFTGCNGGQSYAAWANVGQPEYIGDNCAFANAAKAASQ